MRETFHIHKLGGASFKLSKKHMKRLIEKIIEESKGAPVIFVVSAMAGVTRILDEMFVQMKERNKEKLYLLFKKFKKLHYNKMRDFGIIDDDGTIKKLLDEVEFFINKKIFCGNLDLDQAYLGKYGELLSSTIFYKFLSSVCDINFCLIDARNCISTKKNCHSVLNAEIDLCATFENTAFHISNLSGGMVTQGYIASDSDSGDDTLLGYDGSDLSAAIIALVSTEFAKKVYLTYWKNVLGVIIENSLYRILKRMKILKFILNWKISGYLFRIFKLMEISKYLHFAETNTVPVREDSLKCLEKNTTCVIRIRSFLELNNEGTLIVP